MRNTFALLAIALIATAVTGCNTGEVTQAQMEQVRQEMSQEAYEQAMRDAGRGAELEAQQAADRARGNDGG